MFSALILFPDNKRKHLPDKKPYTKYQSLDPDLQYYVGVLAE
jgi:hypothetical protein